MNNLYIKFSLLILFLSFSFIKVSGQTTIWSEDFSTYTDKTINGENNGVTWSCYVDNGSVYTKPSNNSVKNEKIEFKTDQGGDYVWETSDINVSSYSSVKISADLVSSDNVEGNESIRFYYSVDKGVSYQLFDTNSSHSGLVSSTIVASHALATASNLRIKIVGEGFDYNDTYRFDNIVVIGEFDSSTEPIKSVDGSISIWSEDFSTYTDKTINGEKNGVTWSCFVKNGNNGWTNASGNSVGDEKIIFKTDQGGDYVWETSDINVSSYSSVKISVDLLSSEDVEGNESISFYYSVDKGVSYQLFDTNSSHSGSVSSTIVASHDLATASNLRIKIVGEDFDWNDVYSFDNVLVYSVSAIPIINIAKAFAETCNGNDGVIQFYETTPAIDSGLDFSIDGGSTWQTSPVFTGLSVGNYNLRIRNTGGGTNSADYSLSVGSSSALTISTDVISNENCNVTSDGAIDVSVSGGRTGCMQTDGSTGMIDLQSHFLTGLSAFTMEGWVKLNDARSTYTGQQSFFGQNDVIEFGFEDNYFCCWTDKSEKSRTSISNYPDDQEWHHVAAVGTGTKLSLYIDGKVVASISESSSHTTYGTDNNYTVKIGAGVWNGDDLSNSIKAVFADVRFWSDARTEKEIHDNMSVSLNGNEADLIAVYKMDAAPVDGKTYGIGLKATVGIVNSGASWIETDPIYFYSWAGPDSFVSTEEDLTALSAGTYNLTVSDLNACTVSKSFDVEVEDTEAPVPDLATLSDINAECEVSSLTNPSATDACGSDVTITNNATLPISGEGPTVVTWTYTDDSGNSSTQDQNVVIKDVTPPVFQNPQTDIAIDASGNSCGEVVNYTMPSAIDNCTAYTGTLAGFTYLGTLDNHTYYHSDKNATASDAMLAAASVGGHLVTITSQAENDFVNNLVGSTWIGINDTASEGTFVWSNGEAVSYTNWSNGEPNDYNIGEDYAEMNSSGKWNDLPDTYPRTYVIEFEGALVTQTEGLPSGSKFPVGTTTNRFEATDNAGNISDYSFTVSVADVTPPKILPLRADYYDGINFDTFKETSSVDEINYSWGTGAPESALVGKDYFSIRFKGTVQVEKAGTYTFYTTSDDGVRLWVNGDAVIDNWTDHASMVNTGTVTLSAGQFAPIVLEFYENTGNAVIKLEMSGPGLTRQFVKSNSSGSGFCQDVTVDVSTTGSYTLTVDEADPGYSDACGIASRTLSKTDFTCADAGDNAVTLKVTDVHGNSSECKFNVAVVGNADADLAVGGDTRCEGEDAQVSIYKSEVGFVYSVYKDGVKIGNAITGDGGDISFTIPDADLAIGDNTISFKASNGSCEVNLTHIATVVINKTPKPIGIFFDN